MPNISGSYSDPVGIAPQYGTAVGATAGSTSGVFGMGGTGFTAAGVSGAISGVGNAVSDIFSGITAGQSAAAYEEAAQVALSNENVVKGSLVTQIAQQQRAFNLTMGSQAAQIGAAGFSGGSFVPGGGLTESGTGAYLKAASTQQFNLNTANTRAQAYLTEQGYAQQAAADESMAKQAQAAQSGSFLGAGFSAVSSIAMIAMMA